MKKSIFTLFLVLCIGIFSSGCNNSSESNDIGGSQSKSVKNTENSTKELESRVIATIYMSDQDAENLIDKEVSLEKITAESIFDELKNVSVIVSNTKLNSFDQYTTEDDLTIGVIDFSEEFYNFNLGSSYESMMLDSIAKTYIENFNLDKFKILVNGEEYESGHILFDSDDYFTPSCFN